MKFSIRSAATTDIYHNQSQVSESNPVLTEKDSLPDLKNPLKINIKIDERGLDYEEDISMGLNAKNQLHVVKEIL
jgi:hypothetical protein